MPEKTKLESEIEIFRLRYEQKLRNRRVRVNIDGYDIDTVIMALDNYSKKIKPRHSEITSWQFNTLLFGNHQKILFCSVLKGLSNGASRQSNPERTKGERQ